MRLRQPRVEPDGGYEGFHGVVQLSGAHERDAKVIMGFGVVGMRRDGILRPLAVRA